MSKESSGALLQADSQIQETRNFIKKVRRIPRRRIHSEREDSHRTGRVSS